MDSLKIALEPINREPEAAGGPTNRPQDAIHFVKGGA